MCRRKRLRSWASSSSRWRSHSSWPPRRSRSCGPRTAIGLVKVPSPSSLMARSSCRSGRPTPTVRTQYRDQGQRQQQPRPTTAAACGRARSASWSAATARVDLGVTLLGDPFHQSRELREARRAGPTVRRARGADGGCVHQGDADTALQIPDLPQGLLRVARGLQAQLLARVGEALVLGAVQVEELRVLQHLVEARGALERGDLPEQRPGWRARRSRPCTTIFCPVSASSRICRTAVKMAASSGTAINARPSSIRPLKDLGRPHCMRSAFYKGSIIPRVSEPMLFPRVAKAGAAPRRASCSRWRQGHRSAAASPAPRGCARHGRSAPADRRRGAAARAPSGACPPPAPRSRAPRARCSHGRSRS